MEKKTITRLAELENFYTDDLNSMNSLTQSVIENVAKQINVEMENLIRDRLQQRAGISLDIIEESKRRFPRIKIESTYNETSYYFNDGSVNGILLITFKQADIDFNNNTFSTGMHYI